MKNIVPIALFAYSRPNHLKQTLEGLRRNNVPVVYAFSDGPEDQEKETSVIQVRNILHEIDWCKIILVERNKNLGLGKSIRDGISQVLTRHNEVIVIEDDMDIIFDIMVT